MDKKDKSQQTENSSRQETPARQILKALASFETPEVVSEVDAWLERTKPLQSLVKSLCKSDRSGRLTLECVYVLFDLMATQGEAVSPAVWDILEIVEEEDVKYLVNTILTETAPRLKNCLRALITGASGCGEGVPMLEAWCHAFIQGLEQKEKHHVLIAASEDVASKLLNGIILPHSRKVSFSLFERLLYPMNCPHMFNRVADQLPEVLSALQGDEICESFCGLIKAILDRFPPVAGREEIYRKLREGVGQFPEGGYRPTHAVWNQKPKATTELSSILECPVCYERFVTPITACENGHCICSNCKDQLKMCPICRGHISNIRMTIMDQIMEVTEFHCKNFDAGCEVKLPYKEIWNHELDCEYRTMSCDIISSQTPPKLVCNEDVVVAHFHEHIEKCHKTMVSEFELNVTRKREMRRQKANEVRLLKNSEGSLYFIERIYITEEEVFFSYHYVGRNEDAKNYVYTLKIKVGGIPQKISYTNYCLPNYMGVFDTEVDERCLILEPEKIFAQQTKFQYSVKIEDVNVHRMRVRKNKFLVSK